MKALVLTAGKGTRLGALTAARPKPLLDVGGRPILHWTLMHLAREGISDVQLNLCYLGEQIRASIGDGAAFGLRVTYVDEPVLRGTAGTAVDFVHRQNPREPFLVVYGDLLFNEPLAPLIVSHNRRDNDDGLTMVVHRREGSNSVVVVDDDDVVTSFVERPTSNVHAESREVQLVNSGIYVVSPSAVTGHDRMQELDFPRDIFPTLVAKRRLFAHRLTGYRCAIDSERRLWDADAAIRRGIVYGRSDDDSAAKSTIR